MTRTVMLIAHHLCSGYGPVPVLSDVSLQIHPRKRIAILGRNGMGKTTLLRTLMGLLRCVRGRIEFNGVDITGLPAYKRVRQGLGYVPQGREIFPSLTVRENLLMGAITQRNPRDCLERVLDQFPMLRERLAQRAGTMSGGEQQILAFGRALMSRPAVLLLDEPTEGIQPSIVEEIKDEVVRINEELGITIVLVEQNLEFTRDIAQRVYLMAKGQIVRDVTVNQLSDPDLISDHLGV